jgi:aliphatic nitrilase
MTAIVSPEGAHLVPPLTSGEGILVADLDMALCLKRKRMMDSVGHYARPELLSVVLDDRPQAPVRSLFAQIPDLGSDPDEADAESPDVDRDGGADQRVAVLRSAAGRP